jgi:U3 small nucleolar RNA-associated protein 3
VNEGRRVASSKILKSKGLKRYRNKEDKNPRVKHRRRYDKALKKRKGIVQEYAGAEAAVKYGGEATGIKPNLSRSVKLQPSN